MPSSNAETIVAEARSWVGTRYVHQHRAKGLAVDCVGLILGVGAATGALAISREDWAPYANYSKTPNPAKMREAMARFLVRVDLPAATPAPDGCIGWIQWREDLPMHLAIMATFEERRTMIHSFEHAGGCVEHGFVPPWPERVGSWWRYPGMAL